MDTVKSLIDGVRAKHQLRSDYALAKFLGVTTVTVQRWRLGRSMTDENAIRFAKLLDLSPAYVLASLHAEAAGMGSQGQKIDSEASGVWRQIADMLKSQVALWLGVSLGTLFLSFQLVSPAQAGASALQSTPFVVRDNVYYVTLRLFLSFLRLTAQQLRCSMSYTQKIARAAFA